MKKENKNKTKQPKASHEATLSTTMVVLLFAVLALGTHLSDTNERQRPYCLKQKELGARADSLGTVIRISDAIAARYDSAAARNASKDAAQELQKVDSAYLQARADYDANESFLVRAIQRKLFKTK